MEKGHTNQEEKKEYKIPVSIFEAIRTLKGAEEKSLQEKDPEKRPAEKEKRAVALHHLFPFL